MGTLSLLGLGGGKPNSMSSVLGGGDPEDPKKKKVFKTQAEIDAANAEAQRMAKAQNYQDWKSAYVARKIGDPVPKYIDAATGKEFVPSPSRPKRMSVPNDIKLSDIKSEGGAYWYEDPHTGDVIEVDPSVVSHPRFKTDKKKAEQDVADRTAKVKGKLSSIGLGGAKSNSASSIFGEKP